MTEFYDNATPEEIESIIRSKLALYGEDFRCMPLSCELKLEQRPSGQDFIVKAYARKINVNARSLVLTRFIGMSNGVELYHFYNAVYDQ